VYSVSSLRFALRDILLTRSQCTLVGCSYQSISKYLGGLQALFWFSEKWWCYHSALHSSTRLSIFFWLYYSSGLSLNQGYCSCWYSGQPLQTHQLYLVANMGAPNLLNYGILVRTLEIWKISWVLRSILAAFAHSNLTNFNSPYDL